MRRFAWPADARRKRTALIRLYAGLLAIVGLGVLAWVLVVLSSARPGLGERLAEVGDILAFGTLALAGVAGFVALQAYGYATGLPDLQLQVIFPFSEPNRPGFQVEQPPDNRQLSSVLFKQTSGTITLRNTSAYPARNPTVVLKLNNLAFLPSDYVRNDGWATVRFVTTVGAVELQSDGGYSIHGQGRRSIPIDLTRLIYYGLRENGVPDDTRRPSFDFEIFADGYSREVTVPVDFKVGNESLLRTPPMPEWL